MIYNRGFELGDIYERLSLLEVYESPAKHHSFPSRNFHFFHERKPIPAPLSH